MTRPVSAPVHIEIKGNVENGNIVVGDNNFVVNTNHGTIVYQQAKPQVRLRDFAPQSPRAPRGFVNRTAELQKLETWISSNEMVLIHGLDGMGKSSLLKQAANSQPGRDRPNGVILLENDSTTNEILGLDDMVQRLFDALFESDPPLKVDATTARTYLSNTRPLVLLDEVPLSPGIQRVLPDLFPNGALLFTSDVALGREDFLRMSIGPLPREAATRLLAEKAGIETNEENRAALGSICELLEDASLAVVLTANVVREIRIAPQEAREKLQALSTVQKSGIDRAYTFAFEQLKPEEREILSAAALTPGISMTPEWLAAAFGSEEAGHFIERLKALGLLVTNSPRLRVPPGLRIPVQLNSSMDENTLFRNLADFLIASLKGERQNWELISEELGNLFGALAWATRTGNWRLAIQLARALEPYLTMRGFWDAWRDVLDLLLNAARQSGDRAAEAYALHQSGVREIGVGLRQRALALLRQALEIRQALGDTIGMAYTQHNIDFLIGPPPPPRSNEPEPPSPKPMPAGVKLLSFVGAVGVVATIGLGVLGFIFRDIIFPPSVPPPTHTPSVTPSRTPPIPTRTITPTPTQPPPRLILDIELTNSRRSYIPFLYQGTDFDYFEFPVRLSMNNWGEADITDFDFSILMEAGDGRQPVQFRFADQNTYVDSQQGLALPQDQVFEAEIWLMIPRFYEGTAIRLAVLAERCQKDVECAFNDALTVELPTVVYDFVDSAQTAKWLGYDPNIEKEYDLRFDGAGEDDPLGFARFQSNQVLEDGSQPLYVLATHPTWVNGGTIEGLYLLGDESVFVRQGDIFLARYGFVGGGGGDGVTFHLNCVQIKLESMTRLLEGYDSNDGKLLDAGLGFSDPPTECEVFSLWVDAGKTSNQDWAVWVSAYIAHVGDQ